MIKLPEWVIFHVPHDSRVIPESARGQFVLDEAGLAEELLKMTDHRTLELFTTDIPQVQVVRAPVSRLVVDVERFSDDRHEPMAACGMGAVYTRTHDGRELRRPLSSAERQALIDGWYRPHHEALADAVDRALGRFDHALVIDAHSFPARPLPYEIDQSRDRPQICIGTDEFHTPKVLASSLMSAFSDVGFTVALDMPFSGALVPQGHFRMDRRVAAAMVEVRRDLHVDETTGQPNSQFTDMGEKIRRCLETAPHAWTAK